jgi:hypothetical protein
MVNIDDIGWGSYSNYEGPLYWGKMKYRLPGAYTEGDAILQVVTATEGGAYDAYNGYDKCICTSGLIQWCDRAPLFLVCNMLGTASKRDPALLAPVTEYVSARGYTFGQLANGKWRFWRTGDGDVVDSQDKQRILYFGGASGLKGQWNDPGQREVAKEWAAACSTVWEHEEAQRAQREHTVPRLLGFAVNSAKPILQLAEQNGGTVGRVFRAAYISFAANNPAKAGRALKEVTDTHGVSWDVEWLTTVLKALTFRPGIAIYPHRYNKIRPVLERLYGIDLPDMADELKSWQDSNGFKGYLTVKSLQKALMKLGYDLGPAGADGIAGEKTRSALYSFEDTAGVPSQYKDGYPDRHTIPLLEAALEEQGDVLQWREAI